MHRRCGHDRVRVEVFAYALDRDDGSAIRRRLQKAFEHWRDVGALADDDPAHGGPIGRLAETRELIAAFNRIPDADTRRDIIRLLRGIADDQRSQ